jgi:hypothetical protein
MFILKLLGVLWLLVAYTYVATYYTALMNRDYRTEAEKSFVHILIIVWFILSLLWFFKLF